MLTKSSRAKHHFSFQNSCSECPYRESTYHWEHCCPATSQSSNCRSRSSNCIPNTSMLESGISARSSTNVKKLWKLFVPLFSVFSTLLLVLVEYEVGLPHLSKLGSVLSHMSALKVEDGISGVDSVAAVVVSSSPCPSNVYNCVFGSVTRETVVIISAHPLGSHDISTIILCTSLLKNTTCSSTFMLRRRMDIKHIQKGCIHDLNYLWLCAYIQILKHS